MFPWMNLSDEVGEGQKCRMDTQAIPRELVHVPGLVKEKELQP